MMKVAAISCLLSFATGPTWSVSAFNPSFQTISLTTTTTTSSTTTKTQLDMASNSRRDAIKQTLIGVSTAAAMIGGADHKSTVANAFSQQLDDYAYEPQQQATDGKWDLNSVFVGDYKAMPGMYPHAAGKIAANGPYEKVSEKTENFLQFIPR